MRDLVSEAKVTAPVSNYTLDRKVSFTAKDGEGVSTYTRVIVRNIETEQRRGYFKDWLASQTYGPNDTNPDDWYWISNEECLEVYVLRANVIEDTVTFHGGFIKTIVAVDDDVEEYLLNDCLRAGNLRELSYVRDFALIAMEGPMPRTAIEEMDAICASGKSCRVNFMTVVDGKQIPFNNAHLLEKIDTPFGPVYAIINRVAARMNIPVDSVYPYYFTLVSDYEKQGG